MKSNTVTMKQYLFGLSKGDNDGANQYLLEAKMFIFYSWPEEAENLAITLTRFHCRVRRVIKVEKKIALSDYCTNDSKEKFFGHKGNVF